MRQQALTLMLVIALGIAALVVDLFLTPSAHLPLLFSIPILVAAHRWPPGLVAITTAAALLTDLVAAIAHKAMFDTMALGLLALPAVGYLAVLFSARREQVETLAAELSATLQSIPDGIVVYDPQGKIVRMNRAADELLGLSSAERARPIIERTELMHIERPSGPPFQATENPAVRALRGETVRGEVLVLHPPTGKTLWVSASAGPVCDGEGNLLGAVLAITDITARHEIEEQREAFTRAVSHDLRQPLTVVLGQSQLLAQMLAREESEPIKKRSIEAIGASAERMGRMIQELVDAARLETGNVRPHPEPVDLRRYIWNAKERLGPERAQRLVLEGPGDLPRVLVDVDHLGRVLDNLLANAFKYSEPGAQVVVRLENRAPEVVTAVSDQGPGIPPQVLPKVFHRYYRGEMPGGRADGLGLGLYIVRGLVEANGGKVWVESRAGVGSTFFFSLPVVAISETAGQQVSGH